jgi:membrane fusion protein, multidrug efflux system
VHGSHHSPDSGDSQMSTPTPVPDSSPPASKLSASKLSIGAGALIALLLVAGYFVIRGRYSERTDDAYVTAHLTTVTAHVPAYVQTLHVDDNNTINAGELLVELDPRDYAVAVDLAQANLAAAEDKRNEADNRVSIADANVAQARAELEVARANAVLAAANFKRLRAVSDARAVSSERIDAGHAAADATRAQVTAAETKVRAIRASSVLARTEVTTATALVAQARADLNQALLNLSYTKISAVEGGTIANKTVEQGNYVQPGQMLLSIVPWTVYIIANFKETQLARIRPGQPATVHVDAFPSLRLKGHVDSLQRGTGSVFALLPPENATGNFVKVVQRVPVKILFDDPREALRWISPGMSVEVEVRFKR